MRYAVTAEQMRAFDAATIGELGLPGAVLMETAGRAVVDVVSDLVAPGGSVAVCCGAGNNGGDGYVIARVLREHGVDATVYLAGPRDRVSSDAALHLGAYERCGGVCRTADTAGAVAGLASAIERADVVVDALFGTGLGRPLEGHYADLVEIINRSAGLRVAVDVPSGLHSDTGAVLGTAVRADATVTMAFAKVGLVTGRGAAFAGRLHVAEIGIPQALARDAGVDVRVVERTDAALHLPSPSVADYKTRRGVVLVVAGSPGKQGAGRLAALAALRAGAGLVTLAGADVDVGAPDPLMTTTVETADQLVAAATGKDVVAIGPGMATGPGGAALVERALELDVPLVIDADGLNHLAALSTPTLAGGAPRVLTPHPGEAARLLQTTSRDVEADRVAAVRELARRTGAVVLLKGAGTLVCDGPGGAVTVNPTGGPALATAGSGDVLTGVIAGLLGQGVPAAEAAWVGAYLHGLAGDDCAARLGTAGTIASDVVDALPAAWTSLSA